MKKTSVTNSVSTRCSWHTTSLSVLVPSKLLSTSLSGTTPSPEAQSRSVQYKTKVGDVKACSTGIVLHAIKKKMSSSSIILSRSFFICLHSKILNFHLEQFHYILSNFKPSSEINQPLLSCGCKTSSSRAVRYFELHAECACGRPLHCSPSVQNTFLFLLKSEFEHVYYWVLVLFLKFIAFSALFF